MQQFKKAEPLRVRHVRHEDGRLGDFAFIWRRRKSQISRTPRDLEALVCSLCERLNRVRKPPDLNGKNSKFISVRDTFAATILDVASRTRRAAAHRRGRLSGIIEESESDDTGSKSENFNVRCDPLVRLDGCAREEFERFISAFRGAGFVLRGAGETSETVGDLARRGALRESYRRWKGGELLFWRDLLHSNQYQRIVRDLHTIADARERRAERFHRLHKRVSGRVARGGLH